jgi:dihydrofolate synthase / folylpolyglutamate synthase
MLQYILMAFTDYKEVFSYFESFTNLEKGGIKYTERNYRIDRMSILLELFGNPHLYFKCIHIAGTKGKGSTAVFIASVLEKAGYKTGLFTSPHVNSYRERITVSLKSPEDNILLSAGNKIKHKIDNLDENSLPGNFKPTTFELLTVCSFLIFNELKCDYAVIETGIGGRLDATNVVSPVASVITPIDLEHTNILGNTITEIAREKAGIIKKNIPVFSGIQKKKVKSLLKEYADTYGSEIWFLDEEAEIMECYLKTSGTEFSLKLKNSETKILSLKLIGKFQSENASLAYIVIKNLFPDFSYDFIYNGFKDAFLPGRMEIIGNNPPFVFDAAHTESSIAKMLESFKILYPDTGILIFGSVIDKSPEKMAPHLCRYFKNIIISTPGSFKKSSPEDVYKIFKKINTDTELIKDPQAALNRALSLSEGKKPVLVTGSFYMVSEIRKLV